MSHPVSLKTGLLAKAMSVAVCAALVAASGQANAIGLLAAYQAALKNDPNYQAAYFENEAGKEYRLMGRSGLLPSLSGNYAASKNRADTEVTSNSVLGPQTTLTHPQYISRNASISLRQPLLNFEAAARYREGVAQTNASAAQFGGRTHEVTLRVIGAYLDALFAEEQVALATAQRDTLREQAAANARLFAKGEASVTDKLETQARLELADAQLIEANDNQGIARLSLAAIIGGEPGVLDRLAPDFRLRSIGDMSFDEWKKLALANNPDVKTQTLMVDIAREAINKNRAGHMPRVDAVASYAKTASETITTTGQDSTIRSIGIQMSIPLYSGGYYSAATRQAVANHDRAKSNLQASIDKVLIDLRKEYALIQSSSQRVEALLKAVDSGKLLVKATEQSIKGGVRINLDLLNAQQQLFTSQRDLAQARFGYMLSTLRLRAAAGTLAFDDVRELASNFR